MLDTNVCVDVIRGRAPQTFDRIRRLTVGQIVISSITLAELRYGAAKSSDPPRNQALVEQFCAPLAIASFGPAAARCYGQVRAALERGGTPIGPLDTLVAAHAKSLNITVVTRNEREFRRVAGLLIENWSAG